MNELWSELATAAGITLTEERSALLSRYLDLLLDANTRMNLTRIVDRASAEVLHVADALTVLPHLPAGPQRLADVGSGGGVPGIPIAILRPDVAVTLIECTLKKAAFLRETSAALGLTNVTVLPERVEKVAQDQAETFDVATVRAVGLLDQIVRWCLPLLRPGGKLLAQKGGRVHDELPAARKHLVRFRASQPVIHPAKVPGGDNHVIVEIVRH